MGYLFWTWGLAMHFAILWGVLDVNFHSPVLKDLPSISPPHGAPAKRLILFVADGLRFRTFLEDPPPYLIKVMNERGTWGVSHTRMPTESRPGHVALAAGLYEDPSALFRGWKENPVDFDSVFNQSRLTWAWGSPDIVPMFIKGSKDRVKGKSYPADWQDFDGNPEAITRLDSWVFQQFHKWLADAEPEMKRLDRIILFLHLLGCDTAGHARKPRSREYHGCMTYVDQEIGKAVRKVEEYFGDNDTAYVFTSDHGMTDWGSHGSGSPDETETPLVAWGSGVNSLRARVDVEQADIAPLISSLLGISIPVNNEGVLPRKYLKDGDNEYGARALISNLKQLELQVRGSRVFSHGSGSEQHDREVTLSEGINRVEYLLTLDRVTEAIDKGESLILFAKESLAYFRKYHRGRLMFYLTVSWLGWITLLFLKMTGGLQVKSRITLLRFCDALFICAALLLLILHRGTSGWRLQGYAFLALLSSWLVARSFITYHHPSLHGGWYWIVFTILLTTMMSYGLKFRWAFGVAILCSCAMQRVLFKNANRFLTLTGLILAVFPLLPVVGPDPHTYLVILGLLIGGTTMIAIKNRSINKYLKLVEALRLAMAALVCSGFVDGRSFISWVVLVSTPLCICVYPAGPKERIFGVALAFLPTLALLSTSYEPLFLIVLTAHLLCWPVPANKNYKPSPREIRTALSIEDFTKAGFFVSFLNFIARRNIVDTFLQVHFQLLIVYYLMLYALLGFFGTGNVASLSSFDPTWTRHFLTIFSPFTMCALIVLKTSVPLLVVGCGIRTLAPSNLFMATILLGDCLSLPVMHAVTPHGSWMDIGSAVSRLVIAITLPCLMLLLHHISYPLVTYSIQKIGYHRKTKQQV